MSKERAEYLLKELRLFLFYKGIWEIGLKLRAVAYRELLRVARLRFAFIS